MNDNESVFEMNNLMKREVYELQKSLQNSFIKQKNLIERIDELTAKITILGGDPNQLELKL
tara:strand:+ start:89 stop:271 length:183 start_codon:yes stop_codon:yes gene_type:complete